MTPGEEKLRLRLYDDTAFWAEHCAKIVNKQSQLVPLVPNEPQLRLEHALESQRREGRPMRAIVLKARKLGFSTWMQAKIMHRITQRQYRRSLVVAQDKDTAGELFSIGERIHGNLPLEPKYLKPAVANKRRQNYILFGNSARADREKGLFGLDSSLEVDTANEVEAGRGFTYTELHLSEVAFWNDVNKMLSLLNAVPDEPETIVVLESTANGSNHFKRRWDAAVSGESDYLPVFAAWHEDPANTRRFFSDEERDEFVDSIGDGEWGEDEPRYVEEFGATPEQLNWRRQAIVDKAESDLERFKQEHPASPEEAFMATGRHVFSMALVSKVIDRTKETDQEAELGELVAAREVQRKVKSGMVNVPTDPGWQPKKTRHASRTPFWRVWTHPDKGSDDGPPGRYVVACDPASMEEVTTERETAYTAIQVIDHRSKEQVAEYQSRLDSDLIAAQLYMAANYWNKALLVVETTGGWGGFIARRVWREYGYPLMYKRRSLERAREKQEDRLGWDTNRTSKVFLEDSAKELLREGSHGIRSGLLANQMTTYVRDDRGKAGPEDDAYADLLMAWMIAQYVAQERVVPTDRKPARPRFRDMDPVTGYGGFR